MDQTNFDQTTAGNAFQPAIVNTASTPDSVDENNTFSPVRPESIEAAGLRLNLSLIHI